MILDAGKLIEDSTFVIEHLIGQNIFKYNLSDAKFRLIQCRQFSLVFVDLLVQLALTVI